MICLSCAFPCPKDRINPENVRGMLSSRPKEKTCRNWMNYHKLKLNQFSYKSVFIPRPKPLSFFSFLPLPFSYSAGGNDQRDEPGKAVEPKW